VTPAQRRDLFLIIAFRTVSAVGDQLALFALLVHYAHSDMRWMIGVLAFVNAAGPVLLAPVTGLILDRVPNRRLLAWIGLMEAPVAVLLGVTHRTGVIIAAVALLGVGVSFTQPGYGALTTSFIPAERMAAVQSQMQLWAAGVAVAGPALAGLIYGAYGLSVPMFVNGASFLLVGLATFAVRHDRRPERTDNESTRHEVLAGLAFLARDPLLRPVMLETTLFVFTLNLINVVEVVFVTRTLHASATAYGLVGGVFGVGMILGSLVAGRIPSGDRPQVLFLFLGALLIAVPFTIIGWLPSVAGLYPCMVLAGIGNGVANVAASTLFALRIPEELRGRGFAAVGMIFSGGTLSSLALGGALITSVAPRMIFHVSGLASIAAIVVMGPFALRAAQGASRERTQAPSIES
jgi:MFS family permease